MQETRVQSLGWEDSLKEVTTTPVFLPGKSHGQRSLARYSPWGHKESGLVTEHTQVGRHVLPERGLRGWQAWHLQQSQGRHSLDQVVNAYYLPTACSEQEGNRVNKC